jgi:hypothetical protein
MKPTKSPHAGETLGQDMLKETADQLEGLEGQEFLSSRATLPIGPEQCAPGTKGYRPITGGGFEDVKQEKGM